MLLTVTPSRVATQPLEPELQRVLEALRPTVMAPRLATALRHAEGTPCHVLDAKYEPGRRCTLLYAVGRDLVRGDLASGNGGDNQVVRPGLSLFPFPADPDLATLPAVLAPGVLRTALREVLDGRVDRPLRVELLRYRPGKRATLAVRVRGDGAGPRCVVKVYHDRGKASAVTDASTALSGAVGRGDGRLRLASVVAYLPGLAVVAQDAVPGRPLGELLLGDPAGRGRAAQDGVVRAATALAVLHGQSVPNARRRQVTAELSRFAARARAVASVAPDTGGALLALADRLQARFPDLPEGEAALVHGDCKPSQFLLTSDEITLLDLDHCGLADQASDVGTFVASLRQLAHRGGRRRITAATAEGLGMSFVEGYVRARHVDGAGARDLRTRVRWYEAVALERKALRAFARAPRSALPLRLVEEAHRQLDRTDEETP